MKKTLVPFIALTAIAAMTAISSCNKEELGNTEFTATIESCSDQQGKTILNGTALNWESGDQVVIYGTAGAGIYAATPQTPATTANFGRVSGNPGNAPFRAYYPPTLTTDGVNINLPAAQTYVAGSINEFPMYAESSNSHLAFKNLCGALKLHLTKNGVNISSISVTANSEINGIYSVSYNTGDPQLVHCTGTGSNTTTISCATAQDISNGLDFFVCLPAGDYTGLVIELNTNDGQFCTKTANTTIPVRRSHYTLITLGENDLNFTAQLYSGALPGLFSVSATQQVHFSQGNLQYQASTNTWRFAEHQYDFVGDATYGNVYVNGVKSNNSNISSSYSGWIDLFGWGTSGWNSGAVCYQPWSTNTNASYYRPGGSWYNNLTGTYAEADWAWHNAIANGGNSSHQWRTLTKNEWDYLLNTRTNASSKRGMGNISGIAGLILLPDNWILPVGCSFAPGFSSTASYGNENWTLNTYTLSQWTQMEAAGALFLPASGYRWGSIAYFSTDLGRIGTYWSSTRSSEDADCAYKLDFNSYYLYTSREDHTRGQASSVRPVRNNN